MSESLAGKRVRLVGTTDQYTNLRPGDEGTVVRYNTSTDILDVKWDSGSTLSLIGGVDAWRIL